LGFWCRYRPFTEKEFRAAQPASLIQRRDGPVKGTEDEELLASDKPGDHERIWQRVVARDFPVGSHPWRTVSQEISPP
jgi:hypothetical protein